MISLVRLLLHRFIWHLLVIQINSVLLQIMSGCAVDLTPLLSVSTMMERPPLLLVGRWLLSVPAIGNIDLLILLLLLL
jgi:hypothetical protein